jgi:transposase
VSDVSEMLRQWASGAGIGAIGVAVGFTRPTVRKYVAAAQELGLERGGGPEDTIGWVRLAEQVQAKVAGTPAVHGARDAVAVHHDYLAERVGSVRLSVLYQRLRDERGLRASWGTFYRYARATWPAQVGKQPRVTVRLDDPPAGDEAQVDFFEAEHTWYDPEAQRTRKLYAFLMTLGHSRHTFLYPVLAEDSQAFLEGHVAAFRFFGGAPRRLVPDNLTAGVVKADLYDPRLNRSYEELARYYGCVVDPSRVRRPQDKPKVERTVDYSRGSFFADRPAGETLAEMRVAAAGWSRDVAGQRVHGTTREQPMAAFEAREREALRPLPPKPWERVEWVTAKVHADCHLAAGGARYSVPYTYVGQQLDVRLTPSLVEVFAGTTPVTSHARATGGRVTKPEHYPEAAQAFLAATPPAVLRSAEAVGPATGQVVRDVLAVPTLTRRREAAGILRLVERYDAARVEVACARAVEAGDARLRTVRGVLERDLDTVPAETAASTSSRPETTPWMPSTPSTPSTASTPAGPATVGAFLRGVAGLFAALLLGVL